MAGQINLVPGVLTFSALQVIARGTAQLENRQERTSATFLPLANPFVAVDELGNALTDILLYFGNAESAEFFRLVKDVGEEKFIRKR